MSKFVVACLIFLWMPKDEATGIHSVPFTPMIDPWIAPSEGVLISENTPVYIARKRGSDIDYQKYENLIKPAIDYALQLPEYQKANVNNFIKNIGQKHNQNNGNSHKKPTVLYPELIVVVAHDLYQKFNKDIWQIIPYIIAFYNGVDTVFREIENPRIRLNIAAIVLEDEYGVFEYLENSAVDPKRLKASGFNEASLFWYTQKDTFPMDSYDALISMTLRSGCHGDGKKPDNCGIDVRGEATISGMCQYSDYYKGITKRLIVTDSGKFTGVYTAAHELGHTLGASHDGSLMKSEQGNYDDIPRCNNTFANSPGYVMFPTSTSSTDHRFWSDCSHDYFQRFLREKNHTCLHNVPKSGQYSVPRLLPGKIIGNFDDLCKLYEQGKPCGISCERILCEASETDHTCVMVRHSVPDGLSCDTNDSTKFCMVGKCVSPNDFK